MTHSKLHEEARQLLNSLVAVEDGAVSSMETCSIYSRLKHYLNKPDEALDPTKELNSIFSDLVAILQGLRVYPEFYSQQPFSHVEQLSCQLLEKDEVLLSRADAVRSLAVRAESRMERYYTKVLLVRDCSNDDSMSAVEKVRIASYPFPYVGNYISMVQSEVKVMSSFLDKQRTDVKRKRIVCFCGSGPLPLTGILMAICMNARVVLIDCDEYALKLSMQLVQLWEEQGVIAKGLVSFLCADGADVYFTGTESGEVVDTGHKEVVVCDVVVVAALIPNHVKEKIAERVGGIGHGAPLVVMRSAHGLTARFAYYQTRRSHISEHLQLMGIVAPVVHDLGDGNIVDEEERPIDFFTTEILNSLEVYQTRKRFER